MPVRTGVKGRDTGIYTLRDIYQYYKSMVPVGSVYDISEAEHRRICMKVLEVAMDFIVNESDEINLGTATGYLRVRKYKTSIYKPKLDYNMTAKIGKKCYHLNLHTKGYYVKFFWRKIRIRAYSNYKYFFQFKVNRQQGLRASANFKNGQDYFV